MSAEIKTRRRTSRDIRLMKSQTPIVVLTAYTAPMARMLDEHVDVLLVGDSLGMVVYGMDTTLAVTVDMMIAHGQAVMRGSRKSLVVIDLPFASYQESKEQAFRTCARVMAETGAGAVKLEGGAEMADTIRFLCERGVAVMGHVGLKPQSVNAIGGFRAQGRNDEEAAQVMRDAKAVAEAGAFSLVIEGTVEPVARAVTEAIAIPTIGIGASPACDGQVLVTEDILGLAGDISPKFVKRFANLAGNVEKAAATYAEQVRARSFPGPEHCYPVPATPLPKAGSGR
jgi:3-methyl-2-oxobutanoate hydroxymethyltransferase